MHKHHVCLGLETWITGAGTTKFSSAAEQAVYGLHDKTPIHVYKDIVNKIVQR